MKEGKVSEAVLRRDILQPLSRAGVLTGCGAQAPGDAAFLSFSDGLSDVPGEKISPAAAAGKETQAKTNLRDVFVPSVSGAVTGPFDRTFAMLSAIVDNRLCLAGAGETVLFTSLLLPVCWEEDKVQAFAREMAESCRELMIRMYLAQAEVSGAILRPVVSLSGFGKVNAFRQEDSAADRCQVSFLKGKDRVLKAGEDLLMTGFAGLAGTAVLARGGEGRLSERFPQYLLNTAKTFDRQLSARELIRICLEYESDCLKSSADGKKDSHLSEGVPPEGGRTFLEKEQFFAAERLSFYEILSGGVFAALWEMAECAGVGLDVDLRKIPVRQETIEICEFFDLNPYQLYGQGAWLIGVRNGEALADCLHAQGIPAVVIGRATDERQRILHNAGERRFLDRPAQDALYRMASRDFSA